MHRRVHAIGWWPLLLLAGMPAAWSGEATEYLPLQLAPEQEAVVESALARAGVPVATRPLRVATLREALPAVCEADERTCGELRALLAVYERPSALVLAGAELAGHSGPAAPLPDAHGADSDAWLRAAAAGYARYGDHLVVSVGVVANGHHAVPTGTLVTLGGERAQLDLGWRDHAWSPARLSSQVLGTEAATLPSATLSNARTLTRLHLGYELFLGELSRSDRIEADGQLTSGRPRLFGFHLDAQPAPGWTLGVSRLMQFGGGGRGASARRLLQAFFNANRYDNTSGTLSSTQEFGNEQFSVTSSYVLPGPRAASLYFEYAAEDTFHAENYRFGSASLTAGLYLPRLPAGLDLRYEFSERDANWFVHHLYGDGLTNDGHVLGQWCGDWRARGDNVGAQCHALQLGWTGAGGQRADLQLYTVQNASYGHAAYRRGSYAQLDLSRPWRGLRIGAGVGGGRDILGEGFARLSAFARFDPLARSLAHRGTGASEASDRGAAASAARREGGWFVDAGVSSGRLTYEQDAGEVPAVKTPQGSAHLGFGLRRRYAGHSDFGARVELDNLRGRLLLAVRALDYRYRLGEHLAVGAFLGAARYGGPTPAYGWYMGAGLQWRDIAPRWDLGLDVRRADQVNRYKTLPGETTITWPNTFYVFQGTTLVLSRRF